MKRILHIIRIIVKVVVACGSSSHSQTILWQTQEKAGQGISCIGSKGSLRCPEVLKPEETIEKHTGPNEATTEPNGISPNSQTGVPGPVQDVLGAVNVGSL